MKTSLFNWIIKHCKFVQDPPPDFLVSRPLLPHEKLLLQREKALEKDKYLNQNNRIHDVLKPVTIYPLPKPHEKAWNSDGIDVKSPVVREKAKLPEPKFDRKWKKPPTVKEYFDSRHRVHNWTDVPTAQESEKKERE